MLLPIVNAIFALLVTLAIIRMLGHAMTVPTVAPTLATMIGLGVGIDYALFIVTRHFRGHSTKAWHWHESIARATRDLGRRGRSSPGHGHDRARLAGGREHPAGHDDGPDGGDRGRGRGLRGAHAAAGELAIAGPHINSLRVRSPDATERSTRGPVGEVGR